LDGLEPANVALRVEDELEPANVASRVEDELEPVLFSVLVIEEPLELGGQDAIVVPHGEDALEHVIVALHGEDALEQVLELKEGQLPHLLEEQKHTDEQDFVPLMNSLWLSNATETTVGCLNSLLLSQCHGDHYHLPEDKILKTAFSWSITPLFLRIIPVLLSTVTLNVAVLGTGQINSSVKTFTQTLMVVGEILLSR